MSENKFIRHLRGENTAKSVLEIKNQKTPTSFANMPEGNTSNANDVYSDHRGDAAGVLKGTENWKLDDHILMETQTVYGDGRDFSNSTYEASGNTLWVDATYTFATARRFMPNTKFVLKLCGHDLETALKDTIDFTLIVKFGTSNLISKTFTVKEQAFDFCKEFVIDFAESNSSTIKVDAGSTLQIQLLCADANAQAVIYNGMTVFTALQRRVDSETVSSDTQSLDEMEYDLTTHINDKNNPHEVTKAQVGLGNCDNTSDKDKPISTATQKALDGKVSKTGDSMDGRYILEWGSRFSFISNTNVRFDVLASGSEEFTVVRWYNTSYTRSVLFKGNTAGASLYPGADSAHTLGLGGRRWERIYVKEICGDSLGSYILTPPQKSGVIATMDDVDQAANSGSMITDTGLWYAKMYAATTPPAAADGTNYADFSQVDQNNNPIIVLYERQSGAWVQTEVITPPALYDGYVPITKKIWDITEQDGQQGGRILWNHTSKEFTPYPNIVTTDGLNITNSTITSSSFTGVATLSATSTVIVDNPTNNSIVNYGFVINRQNWQNIADVTWAAATTVVLSDDKTIYFIDATSDTAITIDASAISVVAGDAKTFEIHISCGATLPVITWTGIDNWLIDSETTPIEVNATSIFAIRVQQRPSDVAPTVVANYGGAY